MKLPRAVPIYGLFTIPMGRLFKVCAEPCMYSPGYIRSNKPRWPRISAIGAAPCAYPGCTNPPTSPVHAWCKEHDRKGGHPHG